MKLKIFFYALVSLLFLMNCNGNSKRTLSDESLNNDQTEKESSQDNSKVIENYKTKKKEKLKSKNDWKHPVVILSKSYIDDETEKYPKAPPPPKSIKKVSKNEDDNKCYEVSELDSIPLFPDGIKALREYFDGSLSYPISAKGKNKKNITINFIIEKDGNIGMVLFSSRVSPSFDKKVAEIIKSMPKWQPGKIEGKIVRTSYAITFEFDY